ncbi:MAG TPA: alanine racemase [Caulobacteraceae bacterium]|jgi:D-serine deaminase-like pyridoxal phosphate-dependent protein
MKRLPRDPRLLSAAALASRFLPGLREKDRGAGGHDPYFAGLQAALKRAGVAQPTLVIDRQRLAANVETIRGQLAPSGLGLRVVSKSLPAPALLDAVLAGTGSERLMVFNGVMLDEMAQRHPALDVLTGRPLPAAQVADFVRRHANSDAPAARPQWLADSARRLRQYAEIARAADAPFKVNLEIDVGLHRGGLPDLAALAAAIDVAKAEPLLRITGLMGYDPQVAGAPSPEAAEARVQQRYAAAVKLLAEKLGDASRLTLNSAGSPTYLLHLGGTAANEVSIGSAFVKPAHFDLPTLKALQPAAFIAEPVLKVMDPAIFPRREALGPAYRRLDPNSARGFFLYGGYGDARPVSPRGLRFSAIWGGRGMLAGSARVTLAEDDFVFMRPTESEGVFLQFGDIAVYDGAEITAWWPTFPIHA